MRLQSESLPFGETRKSSNIFRRQQSDINQEIPQFLGFSFPIQSLQLTRPSLSHETVHGISSFRAINNISLSSPSPALSASLGAPSILSCLHLAVGSSMEVPTVPSVAFLGKLQVLTSDVNFINHHSSL